MLSFVYKKITLIVISIIITTQLFSQKFIVKNYTEYNDSLIQEVVDYSFSGIKKEVPVIINISSNKHGMSIFRTMEVNCASFTHTNYYTINIENRLGERRLTKILFHELEHVKQFLSGDLRQVKDGVYYKGFTYYYEYVQDAEYCTIPWEREAIAKSRELHISWRNQFKKKR